MDGSEQKVISEAVKRYLGGQGITLTEAASRIGVSKSAVSNLLNGSTRFGALAARKWSDAFGFNPDYLMFGKGALIGGREEAPAVSPELVEQTANTIRTIAGSDELRDLIEEQRRTINEMAMALRKQAEVIAQLLEGGK